MLLRVTRYSDLDERKLMDVYAESNYENTDYFFPDETDKLVAVGKVEAGFLHFLQHDFCERPGNAYWILEEKGVWVSALRTSPVEPGVYYLEALETRPDRRERGYASQLLSGVLNTLKREGPFRLYDCVGKKNAASLKTHLKCGFTIASEEGYDYLRQETDARDYGLVFRWPEA